MQAPRWPVLLRRLYASDRLWIFSAAAFSRASNFLTNLILARYGGPAVLGAYSATLSTATTVVQPVVWSLSTSATLETRSAPDANARRVVVAAHAYWSLLIAGVCAIAFLILQYGTDLATGGATHDALGALTGLIVVVSMLLTAALQGALHGAGVYKPVAARMTAVAFVAVLIAVPAVLRLSLAGALAALSIQYALMPAVLAYLAKPCARERHRVRRAFTAARGQLIRSVPNVVATFVSAGASWLTTIFLVERSYGIAGVGVFAVGLSWQTIEMMAVTAWGGLSLRVMSEAHASSALEFRSAVRRVMMKDVSFTLAIAVILFLCAHPISRMYGMEHTPLPTLLRVNAISGGVLAAMQGFERSLFCLGKQRLWMRARALGDLCMLNIALWIIPIHLECGAVAMLVGYLVTVVACALHLWRSRWS